MSQSGGTCGLAIDSRRTVVVPDVLADPRFAEYHELSHRSGVRASWTVPVMGGNGEVIAVMTQLYHHVHQPPEDEIGRVEDLRNLVSLAIEKIKDSEDLLESNMRFRSVAAATNDAVWDLDIERQTVWWSAGFTRLFGVGTEGGGPSLAEWKERIHPEDRERVWNSLHPDELAGIRFWTANYRFSRDDSSYACVLDQAEIIRSPSGVILRIIGGMRDITPQVDARKELTILNRALEMLRRSNRVLIRATDEAQLLEDVCKVATEVGGYRMAWVGFADPGEAREIIPVAHAGDEDGYLTAIRLSYDPEDRTGNGPGGRTIRSGAPVICEDIAAVDSRYFWKVEALERDYRSLVCLPLNEDGCCFGFLSLLSGEPNAIGDGEKNLLSEMADNLSYGIIAIRNRIREEVTRDALTKMAKTVSGAGDASFYDMLTENMTESLGCHAAVIGRINDATHEVQTISFRTDGKLQPKMSYSLEGTPCARVSAEEFCMFTENVAEMFPEDHALANMGIEAYAGIALFNKQNQREAILSVLFKNRIADPTLVKSILWIFAERADTEMERERAEAQVIEQASLLNKARDAIFTLGLDHRILYWNKSAARLYGIARAEAMGSSARSTLHTDAAGYDSAYARTLKSGEWIGELRQIDAAGKPLIVESRWNLVRDSEGDPAYILSINTDVTSHKRLEQQFFRAQRLESIGTLAGGIAHDLNNVLTPITMSIELLRSSVTDERGGELLDAIALSSRRGAEMVGRILSFARGLEGHRLNISGAELFDGLSAIIRETFPKNITITRKLAPDLWPVVGNATQLHQVLLNLCVNARDAMPEGGTLAISARNVILSKDDAAGDLAATPGSYVRFGVSDSGHGIPPEIAGKIYDPFFTTKEIGKGTGLGLSTTLNIVKSHSGFIRFSSSAENGTDFGVFIPAFEDPILDEEFGVSTDLPRGNGELIMVIDDEIKILELFTEILENFGYSALACSSGHNAIELFKSRHNAIAVVITDMMMPDLDGRKTIEALVAIDPKVRIIAVSGVGSQQRIAELAATGSAAFLNKPLSARSLLIAVHEKLDK